MGIFRLYLVLLEGITIVNKGTIANIENDSNIVGVFQNRQVIKTNHTYDSRKGSFVPRNDGMSNKDFLDILNKIPSNSKLKTGMYNVQFKNKNNKYDDLVFSVNDKTIIFITVIQQNRSKPTYKSKESDISIILESLSKSVEYIILQ